MSTNDRRSTEEAELTVALGDLLWIPEVWIIRPRLRLLFERGRHRLTFASSARALSNYGFLLGPLKSVFAQHEHLLLAWRTENQRRSLGSFAENAEHIRQTRTTGLSVLADSLRPRQRSLLEVLTERLRAVGDVDSIRLARVYRRARWELTTARALVAEAKPTATVVATQHNFQARAIALAARESRVPTVYVPHAPAAKNPSYADLPFDYAALRGEREVTHYAALGADNKRMYVIGNLALDSRVDTPGIPGDDIVVAPSPWDPALLARFFRIISLGVDSPFDVCPHPRSHRPALRRTLSNRANLITDRPTWKRLSEGAVALIQHSSGVALEAMLMGVPVIEVQLGQEEPNYPLIQAPYAYMVANPDELRASIEDIRSGESPALIRRRRDWAREWCGAVGDEAETRLRDLLNKDLDSTEPLLDGWKSPAGDTPLSPPPRGRGRIQ